MCEMPEEILLKMSAMLESNMPITEACTFNSLKMAMPAGKGMTCEQYAEKIRHPRVGPEADALVDLYFYNSEDCEAALNNNVMPAVAFDLPVPVFGECFMNPGCCFVKMDCLPDGRLQEIHYTDVNCTVPKYIHNTNNSNAIFENGVCNTQGENHFIMMKWDEQYCSRTHNGKLVYLAL